ncbi:hypothetical protein J4407_02295 [Candidatus Pacearchaeota archaeon]|nr:hypothetical protein [Candidatus Pacearchaeota archaeon]
MNPGVFLQYYGYTGGDIGNFLSQLEQMGFFAYALPFLLIFAITFGILSKVHIFKNKSINATISISVGLISLQFGFVTVFFANIFPMVGAGMAIMLVLLILIGFGSNFEKDDRLWKIVLFAAGLVVFVVIVSNTYAIPWTNPFWWNLNWSLVFTIVVIIILLTAIIVGGKEKHKTILEHIKDTAQGI